MRTRGWAYGDFAGFLVAWGYWISIWASLPVIALAFTGAVVKLVPALQGNRPVGVVLTLGAIWLVALVNLRGVKAAGVFAAAHHVREARTVRGNRDDRPVLHPSDARSPSSTRAAKSLLDVDRGAGAAHDVRVPRPRVGDGAGRRRARSRSHHSALDDPRHQHRRAALRAGHDRRHGRRAARPAGPFDRAVRGRGATDVGTVGRVRRIASRSSCRRSAR